MEKSRGPVVGRSSPPKKGREARSSSSRMEEKVDIARVVRLYVRCVQLGRLFRESFSRDEPVMKRPLGGPERIQTGIW